MNKKFIIVALILIAIGSTYWFWLRPAPKIEYVYSVVKKAPVAGDPSEESGYAMVKKEVRDWLDIVGKAMPPLSLLLAFWVKRRKQ